MSQVNALRERLGRDLGSVFIETANRFRGSSAPSCSCTILFLVGPMPLPSTWTRAASVSCSPAPRRLLDFRPPGHRRQLMRFAPMGDRALGIDDDPEYRGWRAHLTPRDVSVGQDGSDLPGRSWHGAGRSKPRRPIETGPRSPAFDIGLVKVRDQQLAACHHIACHDAVVAALLLQRAIPSRFHNRPSANRGRTGPLDRTEGFSVTQIPQHKGRYVHSYFGGYFNMIRSLC